MSERVIVFDTTLRDGEQSPGCSMTPDEKLRFALQLKDLGVDIIEAGFPISSTGDFEAVQQIAQQVRGVQIAALARCKGEDIRTAWQALRLAERPRIHLFLASSDIHLQYKLKSTREEALQEAGESVALAARLCGEVEFSPEDATRTEVDYLCKVLETVIEAGVHTVNIADTVGYTTPGEYGELLRALRRRVRGIEKVVISTHCHNDLGLAVANTLAGLEAGARQIECTVNGIGERAGNAALEEVVMALHVRNDRLPFHTGIRKEMLFSTSQMLTSLTGAEVQANKAVVGRNAFAHEAGIHQHGVMSNPLTYEIMTPESVGVTATRLVLGKHSGRHALLSRYRDLGFELTAEELNMTYKRFTTLADKKKNIYDQDLIVLLRSVQAEPGARAAVMQ